MTFNPPPETSSIKTDKKPISFTWLFVVLGLIATLLLGLYFHHFWYSQGLKLGNQSDFGTFGDFLGGVLNPILGFATVWLLVKSLKIQTDELSLSRNELARSSDAIEKQVAHLEREANLNELMRVIVDLRQQYQTLVNSKTYMSSELVSAIFSNILTIHNAHEESKTIRNLTISNLIYDDTKWAVQQYPQVANLLKANLRLCITHDTTSKWRELESILINFSILVTKYATLASSADLSKIYLNEAVAMLLPFQKVFQTDAINYQLCILDSLLRSEN